MPDDPHPVTLDHGPAIDRSISVDARTDLEGFPPSSGRTGRGLRNTVALGAVIVAAGLGQWAYGNCTATPVRPVVVPPPSVAVATPVQANVADRTDLTGQFSAVNQVVLRARVSGYHGALKPSRRTVATNILALPPAGGSRRTLSSHLECAAIFWLEKIARLRIYP